MSFVRTYGGNQVTGKNTGMKGIEAAINAGMTINQIREQLKREGVSTGERATAFLAARPENSFIAQYGGNEYTMKNAGMQSITAALSAGLTPEEIERRGAAEGVQFMTRARQFLDNDKNQRDLISRYDDLEDRYNQQINSLNDQLLKMRNSYRQPTQVGISNSLTSFNPASTTPMSIKQKGTQRFNRENLQSAFSNPLKITNLNI